MVSVSSHAFVHTHLYINEYDTAPVEVVGVSSVFQPGGTQAIKLGFRL